MLTGDKTAFPHIAGWLEQVAGADKTLLAAFATEKDKLQDFPLDGVKTRLRITGLRGDIVQFERPKGVGWVGG